MNNNNKGRHFWRKETQFGNGQNRSRFNNKRSGGNAKRGNRSDKIDVSRFICKPIERKEAVAFVPSYSFDQLPITENLKQNILSKGFAKPTPIQDGIIPHVLKGKDVVGIADTGTGKTAAFLIPLIEKVLAIKGAKVLIIVPTRELATQIKDELVSLSLRMNIRSVVCVGGANIGRQISDLRHDHSFVIGTPGRLKDLINKGILVTSKYGTLVLDEADRMLDMGFLPDMRFIMDRMPRERHTLFFSATMTPEVEKLIVGMLKSPIHISVKSGDTSKNVEQDIVRANGKDKLEVLHDLLIRENCTKVLVFGRTKHGVEKLSKKLIDRGFKAESIHGNKNQSKRERALKAFKSNESQILVATDVAARGLDIPDVSHVINFDVPSTYEDYVHRIGRTGRAEKKGKAFTIIE